MNSRTSFLNLAPPGGILADLFDVARRDPEVTLAYVRFTARRAEVAARNKPPPADVGVPFLGDSSQATARSPERAAFDD
jgi:hypothetical protein